MSECSLLRVVANIVSLTGPQHRHSRTSGNLVSLVRTMLGRRFRGDDDKRPLSYLVHYLWTQPNIGRDLNRSLAREVSCPLLTHVH